MNFCTILALKITPLPADAGDIAIEALISLVEMAFAAAGGDLEDGLVVSIGPTGSMLLAYEDEADARRAMGLAEAIVTRSKELSYRNAKWPIAGAITQGPVREVNVLGQSWSIEGLPAIAACRILDKLAAGELAIEKDVAPDPSLDRLSGAEVKTITGKRDERFEIRIHPDLRFNDVYQSTSGGSRVSLKTRSPDPPLTATEKISKVSCRLLRIEAFAEPGQAPRIHETHDLLLPRHTREIQIPLALSTPIDPPTPTDVQLGGPPTVFSNFGVCAARVVPAMLPHCRIHVVITLSEDWGEGCVVQVAYRPVPLRGRIFVRIPGPDYAVSRALVVLWGGRERLQTDASALTIGTGERAGRHPIVAGCFDVGINPYARVWKIDRMMPGFDHEISWSQ